MSFEKTTKTMKSVLDQVRTRGSKSVATIAGNRAKRFEARHTTSQRAA